MYDEKAIAAIKENQEIAEQAIAQAEIARSNFVHEVRIAASWKATAESFQREARARRAERDELLSALKVTQSVLKDVRLSCADQNPMGFRDLIGAAITKAEGVRS